MLHRLERSRAEDSAVRPQFFGAAAARRRSVRPSGISACLALPIAHALLTHARITRHAGYTVSGLRILFLGASQDRLNDLLGLLWAACWIAGGWALIQLRVTGSSIPARAAPPLLLLGFILAALWGICRQFDPMTADRSVVAIAPLIVILGMLAGPCYVLLGASIRRANAPLSPALTKTGASSG